MGAKAWAGDRPRPTRRSRGRPRKGYFPPPRKELLDAARAEALSLAFAGRSGAKMHADCGSLPIGQHRWFLVQTHPGQEQRTADELRKQDFVVFLPLGVDDDPTRPRRAIKPRPAAPRYLFVTFDPDADPWRRVCNTFGVARLFLFDDLRPAPARRGDVETLMTVVREALDGTEAKRRVDSERMAGKLGTVLDGAFTSFTCEVTEDHEDGSVTVEVMMFGRTTPVRLERDQVRFDR